MWQILEDSVLTYKQEWPNFVVIVAPALVLGPVFALMATASFSLALVTIPLFLALCLATYGACVRATARMLRNLSPEPGASYRDVLATAPDVLRSAASGGLIVAAALVTALAMRAIEQPRLALLAAAIGAVGALFWGARHAYDQPLVLVHGLAADLAQRTGAAIARRSWGWTLALILLLGTPLAIAGLLSWGFAAAVTPGFGAAVLALSLALWLPLPAIAFTYACVRIAGSADDEQPEAEERLWPAT